MDEQIESHSLERSLYWVQKIRCPADMEEPADWHVEGNGWSPRSMLEIGYSKQIKQDLTIRREGVLCCILQPKHRKCLSDWHYKRYDTLIKIGVLLHQFSVLQWKQVGKTDVSFDLPVAFFLDKLQDWNIRTVHFGQIETRSKYGGNFTKQINSIELNIERTNNQPQNHTYLGISIDSWMNTEVTVRVFHGESRDTRTKRLQNEVSTSRIKDAHFQVFNELPYGHSMFCCHAFTLIIYHNEFRQFLINASNNGVFYLNQL